jgi:hypothetical protein
MKKLNFLLACLIITGIATAQSNFLLYSFKGTVSVTENNVEAKAKVGKKLTNTASIKLAPGSAVTLICNEAAMFTINKPGTFKLNKFGDSCVVSKNSVTANYVKYVWAQMTKATGSPGSNRKEYMNNVGAVTRGGMNNVWIDPKLDTINYSSGEFPLSWKSYTEAKEFNFFLFSADNIEAPLLTNTISKLKISIPAFTSKIKPGNTYYWCSAIKGEENDERKVFNYVTKETYDALLKNIKAQGDKFEAPAEQAYRIGFMLEDAHYLAEAYQYYSKAASLDTANVLYRSTLMSFKKDYEIK